MIPVHAETDTSWLLLAACRGSDTSIFFSSRGENKLQEQAKAICAECTVRAECLAQALRDGENHGVFGGTSERERRRIRLLANRQARQQEIQARP